MGKSSIKQSNLNWKGMIKMEWLILYVKIRIVEEFLGFFLLALAKDRHYYSKLKSYNFSSEQLKKCI